MVLYDAELLANELAEVGLNIIEADGVHPFHTICQWPTNRLLQKLANALDRFVSLPKCMRKRLGVNLVVVARKNGNTK